MSKKKKSPTTMVDHGSLRYINSKTKEDYTVASILLELSHPVVFSSSSSDDSPFLHKWGRTKKRSTSSFLQPPKPVLKSPPCTEGCDMGSTSSSSCLTGEAKKTNSLTMQSEMGLAAQNERERYDHLQPLICYDRTADMRDVETLSSRGGFDLNLPPPVVAEESNGMAMVMGFERMVATRVQAAAQARQRRLALIRSKKHYGRFKSPYQQFK